jgi:hypothetical protein
VLSKAAYDTGASTQSILSVRSLIFMELKHTRDTQARPFAGAHTWGDLASEIGYRFTMRAGREWR